MGVFAVNALAPTLFLLVERFLFNQDPRGYLAFSHQLAEIGILPPDTILREWSIWEATYKYARPGANFGYEAQAYVIFVVPAIFLAWFLSRESASALARKAYVGIAALLLTGLALSLSRTGIFAFLVGCLVYVPSRHKFTLAAGGAALVAGLMALFPDNYFLQRYTMQSADAYSFSYKFIQIAEAFKATFSSPVSILFGNPALMDKSQGGFNPHNQFLADLMTKGLATFVIGLAMFRALLLRLRRDIKGPEEAGDAVGYDPMGRALRASIISIFVQSLSTQSLTNSNTAIMFWLCVFFVLQITRETKVYRLSWA